MASERSGGDGPRYMPEDLHLKGIFVAAASIAAGIGVSLGAAFAVIHLGNDGRLPARLAAHFGKPPPIEAATVLQPDPAQDMRAFTAEKRRLIDDYAWVDRERGIARIPVERAMALIANGANEQR